MLNEFICLTDAANALRNKRVTSLELTRWCLERIHQEDAELRAWVVVDEEQALKQAQQCDAERLARHDRGWLHGIPVGVKDIIDVAGLPTSYGIPEANATPAGEDAFVVRQLRQAGAVILGKTVTTPYAAFDPPPTHHPWLPGKTPGGSSSGSAAAVARGMCLAALATQTGGSITRPAAYCGVSAIKPTFARVSVRGVLPLAPSLDHVGAIAVKVADLAAVFATIACYDPHDPGSVNLPTPLVEELLKAPREPPRLGIVPGPWDKQVTSTMEEHLRQRLAIWKKNGAKVTQLVPPLGWDQVVLWHRIVMAVEAAAFHEPRFKRWPGRYPPQITALIEEGLRVSAVQYYQARQEQTRLRREMLSCFAEADVLVTPATPGPPPGSETTGDPCCNSPWSFLGYPTISFPIARTSQSEPLAVQLIGRPFAEPALFSAALWCEAVQ